MESHETKVAIIGAPTSSDNRGVLALASALVNLLANARDAMPDGGEIQIRAQAGPNPTSVPGDRGVLVLDVQDTGSGMDRATLERIFEPFYTTKPRGKGTGLGLATVHGIVTQNGGAIEADSMPGVGTRFRIFWPLTDEVPEADGADDRDIAGPGRAGQAGTILFVEDNEAARTLVERILKRDGHEVITAGSGEEALERAADRLAEIDLLLTDVVMPGISGIELADRLATAGYGGPVLFVSGYLDDHLPREGGVGEGRELLLKPFRQRELLARVRGLLAGRVAPS